MDEWLSRMMALARNKYDDVRAGYQALADSPNPVDTYVQGAKGYMDEKGQKISKRLNEDTQALYNIFEQSAKGEKIDPNELVTALMNDPLVNAMGGMIGQISPVNKDISRYIAVRETPLESAQKVSNALGNPKQIGILQDMHVPESKMPEMVVKDSIGSAVRNAEAFMKKGDTKSAYDLLNQAMQKGHIAIMADGQLTENAVDPILQKATKMLKELTQGGQ